jgi:hypothetical protein
MSRLVMTISVGVASRQSRPILDSTALRRGRQTGAAFAAGTFVTALILLAGCGSASPALDPRTSTAPTTAAPPSAAIVVAPAPLPATTTPEAAPSGAARPLDAGGLGPDTLGVVVATDGLRVRSLPTLGDQSERFEPTLPEGVRLYVVDGPVTADGYAWYQVQPYGAPEHLPFGWIAAGSRDGGRWIERLPLGCDAVAPSAEGLATGEPLEQLFCSLDGETRRTNAPGPDTSFEGNVYCTIADDHWGTLSGPEWIDQLGYCELRTDRGSIRLSGAAITGVLEVSDSNPIEGRYAIVGHFDDPGARQCKAGEIEGIEADPAEAVLQCRTFFVVTKATPVQ